MIKKLMGKIIFLILLTSCTQDITEPEAENVYWSEPTDEAEMLYFREFDSVRLDSVVAGEIQYRLDIAKSVVPDTTITVHKDWTFGKLSLQTNNELYNAFDTISTFRFNYSPLDSLLSLYELNYGYKSSNDHIILFFPEYYNMAVLGKIFSQVDGVMWAEQVVRAIPLFCSEDIELEISADIYTFTFYGNCPKHTWEVEVVNDSATIIREW